MRKFKLGMGFTVFIIFFGIAMLDAFQTANWSSVAFWLMMGTVFVLVDNMKRV